MKELSAAVHAVANIADSTDLDSIEASRAAAHVHVERLARLQLETLRDRVLDATGPPPTRGSVLGRAVGGTDASPNTTEGRPPLARRPNTEPPE